MTFMLSLPVGEGGKPSPVLPETVPEMLHTCSAETTLPGHLVCLWDEPGVDHELHALREQVPRLLERQPRDHLRATRTF